MIEQTGTLDSALRECRQAAQEGYRIADEILSSTQTAFDDTCYELLRTSRESVPREDSTVIEDLFRQLMQLRCELLALHADTCNRLEARRKELDEFSITLFGRTLAGKSTLMEILTGGDGTSIGEGAQRTTRDVRSYRWRGLKVTDVPGIAAFEGADDERLAFEAAAKADLVLFLITDDAPQTAEAECLARVRILGKPVLGICNVKVAVDDAEDLFLFLRSPKFDLERLRALAGQFHGLAAKYSSGPHVYFVFTHLRSRFLARQAAHRNHSMRLERASQFHRVERHIVEAVVQHGKFLRFKTFIDLVCNPWLELSSKLLDFSEENAAQGRVLSEKHERIRAWATTSEIDWWGRIDTTIAELAENLRRTIPEFVEDNYNARFPDDVWDGTARQHRIDSVMLRLQEELSEECRTEVGKNLEELKVELTTVRALSSRRQIAMYPIVDLKRGWDWGTTALSAVLGIVPVPHARIAAVAVFVVGRIGLSLLADQAEKVRRRQELLQNRYSEEVDRYEHELRLQLRSWIDGELLAKGVMVHISELRAASDAKFITANAQRRLAWALNGAQKRLHRILLCKALGQLGQIELTSIVRDVARVPGTIVLVVDPGTTFPKDVKSELQALLRENIRFIENTGNVKSTLRQAIGLKCELRDISIEREIQVAHVPIHELDASSVARVHLAQQLTELHVMKSTRRNGK